MYETAARYLFDLLDDIDTASDIAKADDKLYRELVEKLHRKRFAVASTDGHTVTFRDLDTSAAPPTSQQQDDPYRYFNGASFKEDIPAPAQAPSDEIERLRKLLVWQPIETAPKDGTDILVWPYWSDQMPAQVHWREMTRIPGRWEITPSFFCAAAKPTHWMPLPAPPVQTDEQGGGS